MLAGPTTADPITVEVIANALRSLVHEMDAAIERTAMSIIIREQHDFGMSLVDARGYEVAGTVFAGQTLAGYAATHAVDPGDVVMFNDPYISSGEISHLGDTMVAVPIFGGQGIIAWGIAWGHHMDIGADAPAAMPPQAIEVYQEGIQIPPVKLYARGVLNEDVLEIVARNSRTPDMMVGDTLALVAAGKIAEKRLAELCAKFGEDVVLETFAIMFQRTRDTMVQLIRLLPEGRFEFEDWLDGDGVVDRPLRIHASLERHGDSVVLDFTGTDSQCRGPLNFPLNPSLAKMSLYDHLRALAGDRIGIEPELDPNQGVEDVVEVRIPPRTLLSPVRPAPVSLRHFTWGREAEVIQGILAQVFPDRVEAASNGSLDCLSLLGTGIEPEDQWLCFEVMAAGGGARPFADGIDGYSWNNRLKNAPVEFIEATYPVRVEQYSLRPGSAGPGTYRGGYGLMRAVRTLQPTRLCFLDERQRTQPWGLHGGRPAAPNDAYVRRADGTIVMLPSKFDYFQMEPGDVFVVRTGGGGGSGDPAARDPELVRQETVAGLLSVEQARDWFGVVLTGTPLRVDAAATDALREVMPERSGLVDRGTPQRTPGPDEYWQLEGPPAPWPRLD